MVVTIETLNINEFKEELKCINWENELNNKDTNTSTSIFYQTSKAKMVRPGVNSKESENFQIPESKTKIPK